MNFVESVELIKVGKDSKEYQDDVLAIEEPLELRLGFGPVHAREERSLAVTMRTPGHDLDLAAGFLFTEGIIDRESDIVQMRYRAEQLEGNAQQNVLQIDLDPSKILDWGQWSRHFYTSSSCGVCGKASIEMVATTSCYFLQEGFPKMDASILYHLPEKLRKQQNVFDQTGGLHAAALFDTSGELRLVREDVGRHNALDKLIGAALKQFTPPFSEWGVLLSGRISFELV